MAKLNPRGASKGKPSKAPTGIEREPVFFGTLRSEFDTEEELAEGWEALSQAAETIRLAYIREELEPEVAASALGQLKLKDRNGAEWTIGASSGEWYRRTSSNNQWLRASAPTLALPDLSDPPRWVEEGASSLIPSLIEETEELVNEELGEESKSNQALAPSLEKVNLPSDLLPAKKSEAPVAFDDPDDFEAFLRSSEEIEQPTIVAPIAAPAPRVNSVNSSDLLGWQPSKRSDGPELPELQDMEGLPELPPQEKTPAEFGYTQLVEDFEDNLQPNYGEELKVLSPEIEPAEEEKIIEPEVVVSNEDDDDDFKLPEDLFYRPPGS